MSLPTERQAFAFLEPLRGGSAIIVVKNRSDNLAISRFLLGCLATTRNYVSVLDTSGFLSTNVSLLAAGLPSKFLQGSTISVPEEEMRPEDYLAGMVGRESEAVLIDDLNAVLYLLSPAGARSRMHHLSAFFHLLSYAARANNSLAIGIVYKTDSKALSARSLTGISDFQVEGEVVGNELLFRSPKADWPGGKFSVPLYFDPST